MSSLRIRAGCLGLSGDFSLRHDFFGYVTNGPDVSLSGQLALLLKKRIHLNLIRVGIDNMTQADLVAIDLAVAQTRQIYATQELAVGTIQHWNISSAQAGGYEHIDNDGEAVELTEDWTVDNSALDVFFVRSYSGNTAGFSAIEGPCDKHDSDRMSGSVVELDPTIVGLVLAHEVGHYLGLEHVQDATRLMNPSVPNGAGLSAAEGQNLRDHCFAKNACSPG